MTKRITHKGKLTDIISDSGRLYVVPDLHGNYYDLHWILKSEDMEKRLSKENIFLCFLGDAIDRGYDSRQVLDIIKSLKNKAPKKVHYILGNHDYASMMIYMGREMEYLHMMGRINSDPINNKEALDQLDQHDFVKSGKMNDDDLEFFKSSPLAIRFSNGVILTHGGPSNHKEPVKDLSSSNPSSTIDMIWGREGFDYITSMVERFLKRMGSSIMINGHTPTPLGFKVNGPQIIISAFGSTSNFQSYLDIDLSRKFDSAQSLVNDSLKRIYGSSVGGFF